MSLAKNYNPELSKSRTWEDIHDYFCRGFGEQYKDSIGALISYIRTSGLDKRLFGLSSVDKLVISIYEPIEWNREALHITFDISTRNWLFVYYAAPFRQPEFVRAYHSAVGIEKFESFIRMINW